MSIRTVIFDIGGILEIIPDGGDPTIRFPYMLASWEARLGMKPGELDARLDTLDEQLHFRGEAGLLGTCTEEEWQAGLQQATGMDDTQLAAFLNDFWDIYMGSPNDELMAYFHGLRPRYQTALLSNSFVGARQREQERFHFAEMTDLIIYSHEEGIAKPDQRIFQRACERLGTLPEEIVFLDDVEQNVAAASACGFHTVLFRDTAQAIADIEACLQASR
ncbi:MAG TPA: HAD family phosphatase [Ktedonobacterales bacterium]|nr:HAD family phosphatase [Ktedonobacterales bacterium]